ncbi:uncharacterized protein LOC107670349 [Sinocyclocheilus anshuiensis]|uniref:uncharacterized protein LOC107670349 n=1 Tax=Sinocyclocheilus anshuiensis TaxID=1608454 RepID=UPI0007B8A9DE|nr:PREDICTED: uncharacterized protein LOC107670349 [Sinocyclocheilus anshuiensis]
MVQEEYPWRVAQTSMCKPVVPLLLLGTGMKSSEPLSELMLVQWALGSSCIRSCQVAPQAVQELTDALIQVWQEIPQIVLGRYFLQAVAENYGFPQRVRIDHGTENAYLADMQTFFRDTASAEYVTLGPSTGNQRTERWWSTLRSLCIQLWMDHLEQLKEDGNFVDTFIAKYLYQFCFQHFIQEELDEIVSAWNCHRIRPTHNPRAPSGRPSIMFAVPSLYGVQNFLHPTEQSKPSICQEECLFKDYPCDEDVFQLCVELMAEHNLVMSDDVYEITDLYLQLRQL